MNKNQRLAELNGLTVTGAPISATQTESIGTGATGVNTYLYNGLFRSGNNTAEKRNITVYVAGEGTGSEVSYYKDDQTREYVWRSRIAVYADTLNGLKAYKIEKLDAEKMTAIVRLVEEDPANANKYIDRLVVIESNAGVIGLLGPYIGSTDIF